MRVKLLRRLGRHPAASTVEVRESEGEMLVRAGRAQRVSEASGSAPSSSAGSAPARSASGGSAAESEEAQGRTLAQLRAEAEERGLPTYGTKAVLAARIADHAADEDDDADDEDDDEADDQPTLS